MADGHLLGAIGEQIIEARRQHRLVAPAFARHPAVGLQIVGGRGDHVGDRIDHVAAAVVIEVDGEALERGRHELRRAEGAGPRADQAVGLDVAARRNLQRGEKLLAEVVAAAADTGERRGRAQHRAVAALGAVIRFHTPDRRDDVMIDAIGALDRGENRGVLRQQLAPARDALLAHQRVEIIPRRFIEFGLGIEQVHDAQVRREPGGQLLESLAADAAPLGLRPQAGNAIAEVGGGGADGVRRHQRMARGARLPAPLARSRRRSRNRRRRRRLKHPCQPVVLRQPLPGRLLLRHLLGRRSVPEADADQGRCNQTKDGRCNCHGDARLRAGAICLARQAVGYVTGPLTPGLCRTGAKRLTVSLPACH